MRTALSLSTALALLAAGTPAAAQDTPQDTPTMIVLDSSGSMINNDAGGQTRIDAAKDAARTFIDSADTPLGLVTYGGNTGETDAERAAGCRDITMVTAPGTDTADDMLAHIDALEPRGFTPIGESLRTAAAELPADGPRTIVLVSDGIDTCAPPPVCEVAAELKEQGVDLVINTVGFNVDDAAREELQCIADAAGGTYADASDADSLAEELKRATTRTYRAYESDLERIDGGTSESEAAEVPRDVETFTTTLPADGAGGQTVVHFRTPVTDGERVIVSATTTQAPSINNWEAGTLLLGVRADDPACQLDIDSVGRTVISNYQTASLYSPAIGDGCDAEDLGFRITRGGDWQEGQDVDVEVTVTRLGIPDMDGQPAPVEETTDRPTIATDGEGQETTPGAWFTDAAELTPGETVRVDIVPGETHFYRLPVEHGQRLIGAITPVEESDDFSDMGPGENLRLVAYNEVRTIVPMNTGSARILADRTTEFGYEAPILFANRYGGADEAGSPERAVRGIWRDGEQYLTVRYDRLFSREDIDAQSQLPTLTYTLVADIDGEPVPAPTFTDVDSGSESEAETTAASASEEPEATDNTDNGDDGDGGGMGLWLGLGALALVILGGAAFAITRRS